MFNGLHYNSISTWLKERFGCRVVKLALDSALTCPNRDGSKGTGGCSFCSEGGSGDFAAPFLPLDEQFRLAKEKVVIGELNEEGIYSYYPERYYTRYEFALMVQRITGIGDDIEINDEETAEETENTLFADEDEIPEWAKDAVMKLYNAGLLSDIMRSYDGQTAFCGDEYITRSEVMKVIGRLCGSAPEDFGLSEFSDLTEAELEDENIKNSVYAGIFNGYEDSTLRLSNNLTRAEAAAVFVRLSDYLK